MPVSAKSYSARNRSSRPSSIISVASISPPPSLSDNSFILDNTSLPCIPIQMHSTPSTISTSSARSTIHIEVGAIAAFDERDLGVLRSAKNEKGIKLVRDDRRTTSGNDNAKPNRTFFRWIASLIKFYR
jgi:hypothetical protein